MRTSHPFFRLSGCLGLLVLLAGLGPFPVAGRVPSNRHHIIVRRI